MVMLPTTLLLMLAQSQPTPPPSVVPPAPQRAPESKATRFRGIPKKDPSQNRRPIMTAMGGEDFTLQRSAPCTLILKGNLQRKMGGVANPQNPSQATPSKTVSERFEMQLPGVLEEETEKGGKVRFRFVPDAQLKEKGGRGMLHMEDSQPAKGAAPAVIDSTDLKRADPFIFFADGRGMDLLPVAGGIYFDGLVRPLGPVSAPTTSASVRPILSIPLPAVTRLMGTDTAPALRSGSLGLWAFANAKSEFSAEYTVRYNGPTDVGYVTGTVEVRFKVTPKK